MDPLSVSQVNAYLACPLKHRFQYIEKIPAPWRPAALAFGSAVHAAVEWFWRERLASRDPTGEGAIRLFDADWYAANLDPIVFPARETKESLLEKGRELLRLYVDESNGRSAAVVEERFEIDLVDPETGEILDVRLRGAIDLIEADGTLVELKTAARAYDAGTLDRHLQLSAYALASFLKTGEIPPLRVDALLKTKVARLDRTVTARSREDLAWAARLIERVALAIRSGHFFPNPSWRCGECEYFAHCQAWRGE